MKLVVYTQIRENYGAHDWDGKGECPQYWKCKGGDVYIVPNLTPTQVLKIKEGGIPNLTLLIESKSAGFEETVVDFAILDDTAKVCAEWETPTDLFYTQGRWVAMRTTENGEYGYMRKEVLYKTEEYELLKNGERANYHVVYTMRNGQKVTSEELQSYLSKVA